MVEWLPRETTVTGEEPVSTNSYTEIATGLHYPGPKGEWLETVAEFVPVAGGYLAARGPHQVALSTDLSTPGAVTIVTPDGRTLRSTPTLLAYVDRVSGKSVRLANLKPSKGELTAPDVVLYPDDLGNALASSTSPSGAYAYNALGEVAGFSAYSARENRAAYKAANSGKHKGWRTLGVLAGGTGTGNASQALGLNNTGLIVGWSRPTANGSPHAVVWEN